MTSTVHASNHCPCRRAAKCSRVPLRAGRQVVAARPKESAVCQQLTVLRDTCVAVRSTSVVISENRADVGRWHRPCASPGARENEPDRSSSVRRVLCVASRSSSLVSGSQYEPANVERPIGVPHDLAHRTSAASSRRRLVSSGSNASALRTGASRSSGTSSDVTRRHRGRPASAPGKSIAVNVDHEARRGSSFTPEERSTANEIPRPRPARGSPQHARRAEWTVPVATSAHRYGVALGRTLASANRARAVPLVRPPEVAVPNGLSDRVRTRVTKQSRWRCPPECPRDSALWRRCSDLARRPA